MNIHVVMANDYPKAVYISKAAAEKLCSDRMQEQKEILRPYEAPRVYWRVYEVQLLITGEEA